ncbi:sugar phosphate isomerase/epimerase family protein [Actinomadura sp. 3N407]|uniref:sugar phosphate isomerase/epimerase family protein n=1 Tax=Actinomadura sp. 3N407 TaxID=3457423 RepID=UPI003FCE8D3F
MRASLGAFLHVTSYDPDDWQKQIDALRGLERLTHLEVWLEWCPGAESAVDDLCALIGRKRIIVHAPFLHLSISSGWSELTTISVDRIVEVCDVARRLGADVVTVHSGQVKVFDERELVLDRTAQAYSAIRSQVGTDVSVALENMFNRRGSLMVNGVASLDEMARMVDRVPDIRFTLDVGHAIQSGERFAVFLSDHADAILDIHLHDAVEGGPAHLRLGAGQLELKSFIGTCEGVGYDRFLSLETIGIQDTVDSWDVLIKAVGESLD